MKRFDEWWLGLPQAEKEQISGLVGAEVESWWNALNGVQKESLEEMFGSNETE